MGRTSLKEVLLRFINHLISSSFNSDNSIFRSSHSELFLRKGVLKLCSKFIGEHPCWSVISINLQSNFIEIALQHGCSPVNMLHIFITPFPRNTSEWLLLYFCLSWSFFTFTHTSCPFLEQKLFCSRKISKSLELLQSQWT